MATGNDLIDQAFVDLQVIQPGEAITTTLRTDGQLRLNQLLSSLSTEGLTVFNQAVQTYGLSAGLASYTLGTTGSWNTYGRPGKVTGWNATGGVMRKGGPALSFADYDRAIVIKAQELQDLNTKALSEGIITSYPSSITAPVPSLLGADTNYPNINIRIYPPPSAAPGSVELTYWLPVTQIAD